jgi:hypothetical protein
VSKEHKKESGGNERTGRITCEAEHQIQSLLFSQCHRACPAARHRRYKEQAEHTQLKNQAGQNKRGLKTKKAISSRLPYKNIIALDVAMNNVLAMQMLQTAEARASNKSDDFLRKCLIHSQDLDKKEDEWASFFLSFWVYLCEAASGHVIHSNPEELPSANQPAALIVDDVGVMADLRRNVKKGGEKAKERKKRAQRSTRETEWRQRKSRVPA